MQMKNERRGPVFPVMICTLLATIITVAPAQAGMTFGHQVLLEKGLQIETLCMPSYIINDGGAFNLNLYKEANFTTINLWHGSNYDYFANRGVLPGGANSLPFSHLVNNTTTSATANYTSNLVRLQYGDEQDLVPSSYPGYASTIATLKQKYPNTIVYMNNDEKHYYSSSSLSELNNFVQTVRPDMLSFTCYPFRWLDSPYYDYEGGSPTLMYKQIELYRKAGLAGLTGDGSQPIPVSMFVQTFCSSYELLYKPPSADGIGVPAPAVCRLGFRDESGRFLPLHELANRTQLDVLRGNKLRQPNPNHKILPICRTESAERQSGAGIGPPDFDRFPHEDG